MKRNLLRTVKLPAESDISVLFVCEVKRINIASQVICVRIITVYHYLPDGSHTKTGDDVSRFLHNHRGRGFRWTRPPHVLGTD